MGEPRMTQPTQAVLRVLLADPAAEFYGLELGARAGLPSGTVHPILARLEACGWVDSRWEEVDPRVEGRPRRRYYRLTGAGGVRAGAALARAEARTRQLTRRAEPGYAGGAT
ncbi:helix-turn-helix transcriptional regulator [Actinokineospora auranticolor]|uniref:PadR family transcriptional regulator n=1 Tax=Actinokineospora auranticolor TaxID=155976 RepID=A0A2S6GRX4_9PSEU|nr:helix-turn-helix transcriptional regulator [Actinokineospora auranticolor]PPK68005.1 PadR family transcriptional regulator [Actinokineospora auranticolor]